MDQIPLDLNPPEPPKKIQTGLELGHEAAEKAADHAERQEPGWKDMAFEAFCAHGRVAIEFTTEDVRLAFPDLPPAPDQRAWGAVALRAKKDGMVQHVRYVKMKERHNHAAPKSLWRWVGA